MRFENIVRGEMEDCFHLFFFCCCFFPTSILYSCVFAQSVMGCMYLTMQIEYRKNISIKYYSNHNISVREMICGTFQT